MPFVKISTETGEARVTGQPGTNIPEAQPEAPAGNYQARVGGEKHIISISNGVTTEKHIRTGMSADSATVATSRVGGSLSGATGPDSIIETADGDRTPAIVYLQCGWIERGPNGGYVVSEAGKATGLFAGFKVAAEDAPARTADQDADQTDADKDAAKDDQPTADPFATEASTAFVSEVVEKVGDSPVLYALQQAAVEGNETAAQKLVADLAQSAGIEPGKFQENYNALIADRVNAARSLIIAEVGLDAYEMQSFEQNLQADPRALRVVREAIANGDKAGVVQAAQQFASDQLLTDAEIEPVQEIYLDGKKVAGTVYKVNGRWAVELATGERQWLSHTKVTRIEQ